MPSITIPLSSTDGSIITVMDSETSESVLFLGVMRSDYVVRFSPKVMDGNMTMGAIYEAEREEIRRIMVATRTLRTDRQTLSMGVARTRQWEDALGIDATGSVSLNDRREAVRQLVFGRTPLVRQNFGEFLDRTFGEGERSFELFPDEFFLAVYEGRSNVRRIMAATKAVRWSIPANIEFAVSMPYTYLYLGIEFTYGGLEELGLGELSKYATEA